MFFELRNRFLALLMVTVTALTALFFTSIVALTYQNADRRSEDILIKGFSAHETDEGNRALTDRFSPVFSIDVDGGGTIEAVHSSFEMDEGFYEAVSQAVLNNTGGEGNISYDGTTFKFKTFTLGEGSRIVFLDISRDIQSVLSMTYSLLWISIPLLLLIFFISKYFADKAIKPIEESFERQNRFIADASHELKTPLATIGVNASLLLADATEEQRKWLAFIRDEAERLDKLTNGLLYLSREPSVKAMRVRCSFSETVNRVLFPLEAVLYEKQIECESEIENDIYVLASEEQLHRLVSIFIENAVKYAEDKIVVTLRKQNRNAVFTISNNGTAIAPQDIDKIWDRFYRADKARQSRGGFGLGLAMAKSIADELKGHVHAECCVGEITTFTVSLPLAQ